MLDPFPCMAPVSRAATVFWAQPSSPVQVLVSLVLNQPRCPVQGALLGWQLTSRTYSLFREAMQYSSHLRIKLVSPTFILSLSLSSCTANRMNSFLPTAKLEEKIKIKQRQKPNNKYLRVKKVTGALKIRKRLLNENVWAERHQTALVIVNLYLVWVRKGFYDFKYAFILFFHLEK